MIRYISKFLAKWLLVYFTFEQCFLFEIIFFVCISIDMFYHTSLDIIFGSRRLDINSAILFIDFTQKNCVLPFFFSFFSFLFFYSFFRILEDAKFLLLFCCSYECTQFYPVFHMHVKDSFYSNHLHFLSAII